MLNRHKLTPKISFLAILLAMMAWMLIGAGGASGNNTPSLDDVQKPATATPLIDLNLNELATIRPKSQPTECSLTRSPLKQGGQNRSLNRTQLEALTPPTLMRVLPSVVLISTITQIGARLEATSDDSRELSTANTAPTPFNRRTLGTCTVTTSADSGSGSLRQCLLDITANGTITFDLQAFPPSTPTTISLSSALPSITVDGLTIDGTDAGVMVDGNGLPIKSNGLVVDGADGVTIKGLQIVNFSGSGIMLMNRASNAVIGGNTSPARNIIGGNYIGVQIADSGSNNNKVIGNYIGTDATGTTAWLNDFGVGITGSAQNNVIGGPGLEGNLISGNQIGIQMEGTGTNSNQVLGNLIGTDATGSAALGNEYGVTIRLGAQNNTIGGESPGVGNIISGNTHTGVHIQDADTNGNQVLGNFIGTDVTGLTRLGNQLGVGIIGDNPQSSSIGPANNVIGGATDDARNIISGNDANGLEIAGFQATNNRIEGNYIGTNPDGTNSLGNIWGIIIHSGAHHNTIGGTQEGTRNLISGNDAGIGIKGSLGVMTTDNLVQGNYIGTDVSGTTSLPNKEGIAIEENAHRNIIGGTSDNARNIISGNQFNGIWIGKERMRQLGESGTTENQVVGNYIGTDVTGLTALGNKWGVTLNESQNNIVGCESLEGCNIISGNSEAGIMIQEASGNQVIGNFIGTNANGTSALANELVGIGIIESAHDNIIGGQTEGKRNVISGNRQAGVDIRDAGTTANQVVGNYIGTDKSGTIRLSNRWGVAILQDAHHNLIGGTGSAGNLISGNTEAGVQIQGVRIEGLNVLGEGADHNRVQGNYIGTDVTGLQPLGNRWGIDILAGAKNNLIGGSSEGEGNLISGNLESGIELLNYLSFLGVPETTDNQIQGNDIGIGADGTSPLGNGFAGICLFFGSNSNTIGPNNTIAHNADAGVRIQDSDTDQNTITENSIHDNSGLPIDFTHQPQPISPPMLNNWTLNVVSGNACPGCRIEIFANPNATPAGTRFLVAENADAKGDFAITLPSDAPTDLSCLSATATDQAGTTFEFSDNLCAGDGPIATATPTTTNNPTATPIVSNSPTATPTAPDSTVTPTPSNSPTVTLTATGSPTATSTVPIATQTPLSNQLYLPLVIR